MAQSNGAPPSRPVLAVVPAVTGGGSGNAGADPVTESVTGRVTPPPETGSVTGNTGAAAAAVPLTLHERARLAVSHWAGTVAGWAGQLWLHPGRVLHSLWHPEPETMPEYRTYIRSAAWVPEELAGRKSAAVITVAGILYHVLIGYPLKSAMKAVVKAAMNVDRDAERPMRILGLAAFVSALALILLNL
jgi:hypothetical protein